MISNRPLAWVFSTPAADLLEPGARVQLRIAVARRVVPERGGDRVLFTGKDHAPGGRVAHTPVRSTARRCGSPSAVRVRPSSTVRS